LHSLNLLGVVKSGKQYTLQRHEEDMRKERKLPLPYFGQAPEKEEEEKISAFFCFVQ